jgi:D-hydroxyproline dehydrogenase subunit gamma
MSGRFRRIAETQRVAVRFVLDGRTVEAMAGDTLLSAILLNAPALRQSEFGGGNRAGFCLMTACQDCWVWTDTGNRLRACDTPVSDGLRISTRQPDAGWASCA